MQCIHLHKLGNQITFTLNTTYLIPVHTSTVKHGQNFPSASVNVQISNALF